MWLHPVFPLCYLPSRWPSGETVWRVLSSAGSSGVAATSVCAPTSQLRWRRPGSASTFLRLQTKLCLAAELRVAFHHSTVESVLVCCATEWDTKAAQRLRNRGCPPRDGSWSLSVWLADLCPLFSVEQQGQQAKKKKKNCVFPKSIAGPNSYKNLQR